MCNDLTRAQAAAESVITGLQDPADLTYRALSAGTLALLERAGNPLVQSMLAGSADFSGSLDAVVEFVWVHSAAVDESHVIRHVLAGDSMQVALRWGMALPVADLTAATQHIMRQQQVLRGVATEVMPEPAAKSAPKNAPSPR